MAIARPVDQEALAAWTATRPPVVQDLIRRFPPGRHTALHDLQLQRGRHGHR